MTPVPAYSGPDCATWFEERHPFLSRQGLWLRGTTPQSLSPEQFSSADYRILITRLSTWEDTADSFSHRILYQIATAIPGIFADFAYLPPCSDLPIFRQDNIPLLLGVSTHRPGTAFDCIAISNAIVQELINLPQMLEESGISLSTQERLADPHAPLIILGGANSTATSLLWHADSMVDGIFLGHDCDRIRDIFALCRQTRLAGADKHETLCRLESIEGFFRPGSLAGRRVKIAGGAPERIDLSTAPMVLHPDVQGRDHVAISQGCPSFCTFCLESWMHKPYRESDAASIVTCARRLKAHQGLATIDLYSYNFNIHHAIERLLYDLTPLFASIGLKSQRFDRLARNPRFPALLHAVGKTKLTCGLEGISPRLRRYLNKGLDEHDLEMSLTYLLKMPLRELKIFLIATGLETEEDFAALRELLQFIRTTMQRSGRTPRLVFSCTPLVRFPCTPLENEDAPDAARLQEIINSLAGIIHSRGFEFRQACEVDEYRVSQVMVRAVDERVHTALIAAWRQTGFTFYRSVSAAFAQALRQALDSPPSPVAVLTGLQDLPTRPWDCIEPPLSRRFQSGVLDKAVAVVREQNPDIPAPLSRRQPVIEPDTAITPEQLRHRIRTLQQMEAVLGLRIVRHAPLRGLPGPTTAILAARSLMLADSSLIDGYRGTGSILPACGRGSDWITGESLVELRWLKDFIEPLRDRLGDSRFLSAVNDHCEGWLTISGPATPDDAHPPITLTFDSPFPFDDRALSGTFKLKATRVKAAEHTYRYELTKESLKKRVLTSLLIRRLPHDPHFQLVAGILERFDLQQFCQACFVLPALPEWIRIRVSRTLALSVD